MSSNKKSKLILLNTTKVHPHVFTEGIRHNELKGLNVTFINMPLRETAQPNVPPEGPAILSAILRKYEANVHIIDLNGYRIKDKEAEARALANGRHMSYQEAEAMITTHLKKNGDQDLIAFSGKITTLRWQEEMAKVVRRLQPNCFLVTGGGLATEIKTGLFNWIPELDAIARSEGDDVILVLAKDAKLVKESGYKKAVESGKLSAYYVGEHLGRHRFVYEGDRPKNLDAIPYPAFDLLACDPYGHNLLEDYIKVPVWGTAANNSSATPFTMKRSLTTVSSRGCPYACAFCYRGAQGERNYGVRTAEHIAKQVREYVDRYNLDFIGFPDDNFAVDRRRIKKMIPVFKDYGLDKVRWGTHTRMDEADQRAYDMAESGCVYIGFGAESASERTLKNMKKGGHILRYGLVPKNVNGNTYHFPVSMVNAIENCKKAKIHPNCTWIMGFPGETLDDLKTSVAFIMWQQEMWSNEFEPGTWEHQNAKNSVNKKMFTATAYPGTSMWSSVQPQLKENFNISFDSNGDPLCDEYFHNYVSELDDATKVLNNMHGAPVYFGAMEQETFLRAREHVDSDQIHKILEM